jgi:hypothetical protein
MENLEVNDAVASLKHSVSEEIKKMNDELEAKHEDMYKFEVMNQTLLVKEGESNDESLQAHKVLL